MPGMAKRMLEAIIEKRATAGPVFRESTRAKLALRGLNPERFEDSTPDDPAVLERIRAVAAEFGVEISGDFP